MTVRPTIKQNSSGHWVYDAGSFQIVMQRYSDPHRLNLARNAAIYLGKPDRENIRRPLSIIRQGHVPEIFRGESVEFEFVNVSKEVYDHIITYTTRNMRATGGNRALVSNDYTMPSDKMKDPARVRENIERSMENYHDNLKAGETKQVARTSMPTAANMNPFVYQFNFLTLGQSVFSQRIWDKGAQGNTIKVIQGMYELCENIDKELWSTFYEHMGTPVLRWKEVKRKLKTKDISIQDFYEELRNHLFSGEIINVDESLIDYLDKEYGNIKTMW